MSDRTDGPDGRLPRVKGSGDHDWEPWSAATLGRGRKCNRCGCVDDGYQQPCVPFNPTPSFSPEMTKKVTALVFAIADLTTEAVGPNGSAIKIDEEDAPLVRATFIGRLTEMAIALSNGEMPEERP